MAMLKITTAMQDVDYMKMSAAQCTGQQWFYVLLNNHHAPTPAGRELIENINLLDLDSDESCNYFLAGYMPYQLYMMEYAEQQMSAMMCGMPAPEKKPPAVVLDRLGPFSFTDSGFVRICKTFERSTRRAWRYSGECELLMFRLKENGQGEKELDTEEFFAYNLDDLVRNKRTVSQFLRVITMAAEDGLSAEETKRIIDEKYAEMILPVPGEENEPFASRCADSFRASAYGEGDYWFLSYSVKDFDLVNGVRLLLEKDGKKCWMAPFSIPSGTNYAYMIEMAIKHAARFVLFLSEGAVGSVWVGKELKRAITRFQKDCPEKLRAVWVNGAVNLADTPLALPMEDIQIRGDLMGDAAGYARLKD